MISRPEGILDPATGKGDGMPAKDIEDWVLDASEHSPLMMQGSPMASFLRNLSDPLDLSRLELSNSYQANYLLLGHSTCLVGTSSDPNKDISPFNYTVEMSRCLSKTESWTSEIEGRQRLSPQEQQTRSNAISLIRARTLTRLSPTEPPSLGDTCSLSSDPFHSSSAQSAYSDLGPVVIMQPIQASKKKKKKKAPKGQEFRKNSETLVNKDHVHIESESSAHVLNVENEAMMTMIESQDQRKPQQGQLPLQHNLLEGQGKPQILYSSLFRSDTQKCDAQQESTKASEETWAPICNLAGDRISSVAPLQDAAVTNSQNPPVAPPLRHVDHDEDGCKPVNSEKQNESFTEPILLKGARSLHHLNVPACDVEGKGTAVKVQSWAAVAAKGLNTVSTGSNIEHSSKDTTAKPGPLQLKAPRKKKRPEQKINTQDHRLPKLDTRHAHPSSPDTKIETTNVTSPIRADSTGNGSEAFFWQLDSHGFPCAKQFCDKRCNLWDGSTVICPKCGPFSEVRYCSKGHLLKDIKWHWLSCGRMTFTHPCRENSIPRDVKRGPPLIPCLHHYDTPERHRQAVYFNTMAREGDYFIFSDYVDWAQAGYPSSTLETRCANRILYTLKIEDREKKDRFCRVLAACLFMTIEVHELVDYLYRLIRDELRAQGMWYAEVEVILKCQIHAELAVNILPEITGERHACETDWNGKNRRNCQDVICRGEYRRLLGSIEGKGHSHLVDNLEGTYWILRAARTTHPQVGDASARMRGYGFTTVAEEDRRIFQRGEGWDGAGTGGMEIEGINA